MPFDSNTKQIQSSNKTKAFIAENVERIKIEKYVGIDGVHQARRHVRVPLPRPGVPDGFWQSLGLVVFRQRKEGMGLQMGFEAPRLGNCFFGCSLGVGNERGVGTRVEDEPKPARLEWRSHHCGRLNANRSKNYESDQLKSSKFDRANLLSYI